MGDSSYWTGEPAVRAWEQGLLVLYPNPQMSNHSSAVAKLTDSFREKKKHPVQLYSSNPVFVRSGSGRIRSLGAQM